MVGLANNGLLWGFLALSIFSAVVLELKGSGPFYYGTHWLAGQHFLYANVIGMPAEALCHLPIATLHAQSNLYALG
jgi:hypothetical protein